MGSFAVVPAEPRLPRMWKAILLFSVALIASLALSSTAEGQYCDIPPGGKCGEPDPKFIALTVRGDDPSSGRIIWCHWNESTAAHKYNVYVNGTYRATLTERSACVRMPVPRDARYRGSVYIVPIAVSTWGQEWIGRKSNVWNYWWNGTRYALTKVTRS